MDKITDKKQISKEAIYTIIAILAFGGFIVSTIFIPFNAYLYALVLLFVSIFIFRKPEVGLYLIIVLTMLVERFFTLQPITVGENVYKIYPLDIVTIITVVSFIIYYIRSPEVRIRISKVGASILFFALLCLGSALWGISNEGETTLALSTFKNFAIYAVFFFLVINIIRTREQFMRLSKAFIYTGIGLLFFVFFGLLTGSGLWTEYTPLSTSGTRLLAPPHAFYLSLIVLLVFNLIAFHKNIFGSLTIPIMLVQLVGIIGSLTRHLWLGLVLGLLISFVLLNRKRKKNLLKIMLIQLLLVAIALTMYGWFDYIVSGQVPEFVTDFTEATFLRLQSLSLSAEDQSSYFRLLAWQKAWRAFTESPVVGIGFGKKLTFDYFGYPTRIEIRELHNDFVGIALQMGIVGFISFLFVNLLFIRKSYQIYQQKLKGLRPYLLGFFAGYILFIFSANFGVYMDLNLLGIFLWLCMGAVISIRYIIEDEEK